MLQNPFAPARAPKAEQATVIREALRREFALLPAIVRTVEDHDLRRARRLTRHIRLVLALLREQLAADASLHPLLPQQGGRNALRATAMRPGQEIPADAEWIEKRIAHWEVDGRAEVRRHLATDLSDLSDRVSAHLDRQARTVFTLAHEYVSVAEFTAPHRAIQGIGVKNLQARLLLTGLVLEDASARESARFRKEMPLPTRWLWHLIGSRMYVRHIARVRGMVL